MVGTRSWVAGVFVGAAVLATSARADACTIAPPPVALRGYPTEGETNVPTDVVPVFSIYGANILNEQTLALTAFELTSPSGANVAVSARMAFTYDFELVPERQLDPQTTYTLRATVPATPSSNVLTLSFTTDTGPLSAPVLPPSVRLQHYHRTGPESSTCDPGSDGSCIFYPPGTTVELWPSESPERRTLVFDPRWDNLSGLNQGSETSCLSLRTRAPNGLMSDVVEICRDEGQSFTVSDTLNLTCTDRGFEKGGIPLDGSGGAPGGTGGTGRGGGETGGFTTGGSANGDSAGAPDDEARPREILTEGCGCHIPGARRAGSAGLIVLAGVLALSRRRARKS